MDSTIGNTVLARMIQAFGGILNMFLQSIYLSKVEQGFYYTFISIISIQIFFELGLSSIITQFVAHEVAHLTIDDKNSVINGEAEHKSRISHLLRFSTKIFFILSLVLFIVLVLTGYIFFNKYGYDKSVHWEVQWILLSFTISVMLSLNSFLSFLQGIGRVNAVSKIILLQQTVSVLVTSLVLLFNGKLWSIGLSNLFSIIIALIFIIYSNNFRIIKNTINSVGSIKVNYWSEIFPFQYKIAISWLSGYFIFQLFNPVLFAFDGPVAAGKMGLSMAVFSGISSLTMSWINTKVPQFSVYASRKEYQTMNTLFNTIFKKSLFVCLLLHSIFFIFYYIIFSNGIYLYERLLPASHLFLLAIVNIANYIVFCWATYIRCQKIEPFMWSSLVCGILVAISTIYFGKNFGLNGVVIGYFLLTLLIGLPWAYKIYITNRRTLF